VKPPIFSPNPSAKSREPLGAPENVRPKTLSTRVQPSTLVRKYPNARFRSTAPERPGSVGIVSLLERIESVLEETGWSASEWARRAGLPERSHVNTIIRRLRENNAATVDVQTLAKMADSARVSLDWLALGRGTKDGPYVRIDPDTRYPSRAVAIVAATLAGWRGAAIETVQAMNGFATDPGVQVWMGLLQAEHEGTRLLPAPAPAGGGRRKRVQARKRS